MAVNVHGRVMKTHSLSRQGMLNWVNDCLQSEFSKIEELCTGAAYCQFMDMLFPNSVPMKRIKFRTNLEYEYIQNYKILQMAFTKVSVDKTIPIGKLIQGENHFEFLKWFKEFFDANYKGRDYDPSSARGGAPMGFGSAAKPVRRSKPMVCPAATATSSSSAVKPISEVVPRTNVGSPSNPSNEPASSNVTGAVNRRNETSEKQLQIIDLTNQARGLRLNILDLVEERDFYFTKLRNIEILCQDLEDSPDSQPIVQNTLDILYALEEGFAPPDEVSSEDEA